MRVGDTDLTAGPNVGATPLTVNTRCDERSYNVDGEDRFTHVCPEAVLGKYVSLQLLGTVDQQSFDVREMEIFVEAKIQGMNIC